MDIKLTDHEVFDIVSGKLQLPIIRVEKWYSHITRAFPYAAGAVRNTHEYWNFNPNGGVDNAAPDFSTFKLPLFFGEIEIQENSGSTAPAATYTFLVDAARQNSPGPNNISTVILRHWKDGSNPIPTVLPQAFDQNARNIFGLWCYMHINAVTNVTGAFDMTSNLRFTGWRCSFQ